MKEYIFKLTDKVRDYECDLQGVVNKLQLPALYGAYPA